MRVEADLLEMPKAELHGGDAEEVQACRPRTRPHRATAGARRPWTVAKFTVPPANHGRWSVSSARVAGEQTADAGRVAEHLVEGDADEVRPHGPQVQAVRGHERRCVEQHVPPSSPAPARSTPAGAARRRSSTARDRQSRFALAGLGRRQQAVEARGDRRAAREL